MTKFLSQYTALVTLIISVEFHNDNRIVNELKAKNHFLYSDKCHNSVRNYRNLPINNPKRDIVGTNAYV